MHSRACWLASSLRITKWWSRTRDFMGRETHLTSAGRPRLLLSLLCRHLVLVVCCLHLVPVVVNPQILNLQWQHLHLVFKAPILNLLFDILVVSTTQFTEELVGIGLQLLKLHWLASGHELVAISQFFRGSVRVVTWASTEHLRLLWPCWSGLSVLGACLTSSELALSVWGYGCLCSLQVWRARVSQLLRIGWIARWVRLQIGFGHYLGCLSRSQDCVCEELLDQIGLMCCQESGQCLLDLTLDSVHNLLDLFLLGCLHFNQFGYRAVIGLQLGLDYSEIRVPFKLWSAHLILLVKPTSKRRCKISSTWCSRSGGLSADSRIGRVLGCKLWWPLDSSWAVWTSWVRPVEGTLLVRAHSFVEGTHHEGTAALASRLLP